MVLEAEDKCLEVLDQATRNEWELRRKGTQQCIQQYMECLIHV
jgi:hypothetical protein